MTRLKPLGEEFYIDMDLIRSLKYLDLNNSIDKNISTTTTIDETLLEDLQNDSINLCEDHIEIIREYDPYTATVCALYLIFGIACAFFGYRIFKALLFLTGFIFGSIIVYLICAEEAVLPEYGNAGVALSAGILFGLVTMLVQYVGLFMLGFHTGLLIGLVSLCITEVFHSQQTAWIGLAVLLSSGLLFALFNLYFQKSLTIIGSALYGGAVISTSVDFFLQNSKNLNWLWARIKVDQPATFGTAQETLPKCWIAWVVFGIWPAVFLFGVMIQGCCTGRGIYHQQNFPKGYQKRDLSETKEERKTRKYRYLYQVRRCHGDVIAQVNRPISGKYIVHTDDQYA